MQTNDLKTDRRGLLALVGVAGAALVAACGTKNDASTASTITTVPPPSQRDIKMLRTASSIEALAVSILQRGIDAKIIKTPAVVDTVKTLQAEHKNHAALFEGQTTKAGGQPLTQPNSVLLAQYQGRINALDEPGLLRLAFDLAQQAAATYQAAVGNVDNPLLNVVMLSVAGVEARHAALIGTMINQQVPAGSLATTEKAVMPGTGA